MANITYFLIFLFIIWEFPLIASYGLPYRQKHINVSNYTLNIFDSNLMNDYSMRTMYGLYSNHVSTLPVPSIFWRYYIADKGPVFRYSKLHRDIKNKFKELKAKQNVQTD